MKFNFLTSSKGGLSIQVIVIAISSLFVLVILMFLFGNFFTGDDKAFALDEFSKCKSFGGKCIHSSNCEDKVAGVDCRNSNHVCCKVEESQRNDESTRDGVSVSPELIPEDEHHEQNPDAREESLLVYCQSGRYKNDNQGMYDTCTELLKEKREESLLNYCRLGTYGFDNQGMYDICKELLENPRECVYDSDCDRGYECDISSRICVPPNIE